MRRKTEKGTISAPAMALGIADRVRYFSFPGPDGQPIESSQLGRPLRESRFKNGATCTIGREEAGGLRSLPALLPGAPFQLRAARLEYRHWVIHLQKKSRAHTEGTPSNNRFGFCAPYL